jgi:hypothetical protein
MATVINNPADQTDSTNSVGTLMIVLVVGVLLVLFFAYALPLLRNSSNNRVNTPSNGGSVNIDIPNPAPTQNPANNSANSY